MFFITEEKNTKDGKVYLVLDTEDWVAETHTEENVEKYRKMGVTIADWYAQGVFFSFLSCYRHVASEVGSSTLDLVIGYLEDRYELKEIAYEIGSGSTTDIVKSLKIWYKFVLSFWADFNTDLLYDSISKFYEDFCSLYKTDRSKEEVDDGISTFRKKYKFNTGVLIDSLSFMYADNKYDKVREKARKVRLAELKKFRGDK